MTTIHTGTITSHGYPESARNPHGFDAFLVHTGNALSAWGQRHHERRKFPDAGETDRRRSTDARDDRRSTLTACAHSQLFP